MRALEGPRLVSGEGGVRIRSLEHVLQKGTLRFSLVLVRSLRVQAQFWEFTFHGDHPLFATGHDKLDVEARRFSS